MSDKFRCDYCGSHADLKQATIVWRWVNDLDDGDELFTSALYCSDYCGTRAVEGDLAVGS